MRGAVEKLDRFHIEAVYAFAMANCNTRQAAGYLRLKKQCLYNDLYAIKKRTGLDPYKPEEFEQLYNMVEECRKEKMHGADYDIRSHVCGK
jgi:hypothetical protein